MKFLCALTSTKPTAPFSVKALIYAVLCTLLGTACIHCGIWIMGTNGAFFGDVYHRPYELPAIGIVMMVSMILLCVAAALWFCTVAKARRKWLNLLIAVAVVILCFVPCWILVAYMHRYGEQLGQLILYGREHVYQRT